MHIVVFSINPLFPDFVMGGAPKHVQNIAVHLGELGHDVSVLCTRTESAAAFRWHERVRIFPILPFKQPFPQPYAIPAYEMAAVLQTAGDYLAGADRFYMHDGEFLFPYAYRHIPTVVSLRDNVYPETLLGSFLFQGDRLILISEYSRSYFEHTAGRFFPDLKDRIEVIHNGIDWERFKPTPPQEILRFIPIVPGQRPVILHPHRPEEAKGIRQTIEVADLLVRRYGITDVIVLAPRWHEAQLTGELRSFYETVQQEINERGLVGNFLFHNWLPQALMPEYYSLGSVTLSLGYFQESFGNAVYESMGCGTPSVVARITTHRELLPDALIDKVDYGDTDGAAECAARIIRNHERTSPEALLYLREHYSVDRQLTRYAQVILESRKAQPLAYRHPRLDERTRYRLAPWCYPAAQGVYHDFRATYLADPALTALARQFSQGFSPEEAWQMGMSAQDIDRFFREGYLVPLIS